MNVLQMSARQTDAIDACDSVESQKPAPKEVLEELFLLLEEFGPNWYTESHHERAKAALGIR